MQMFESFLSTIPKNRSLMVNELEIPDDIVVAPYVWTEPESLTVKTDSVLSGSLEEDELRTVSTDSSIPLSRAMTDSEIDYGRHRRYIHRSFSDPWDEMKAALDSFPPEYLASLHRIHRPTFSEDSIYERIPLYNEELRLKTERFFEEECRVFTPDDPGLLALEDALRNMDIMATDTDLDSITAL